MQVHPIAKRGDGMVATGPFAGVSLAARDDLRRSARVAGQDGVGQGFPARAAQGEHLRGGEEVPTMRNTEWG